MTTDKLRQRFTCAEIQRIQEHNKPLQAEGFKASMVVSFDGERTKTLSVTWEQLEAIKQILTK